MLSMATHAKIVVSIFCGIIWITMLGRERSNFSSESNQLHLGAAEVSIPELAALKIFQGEANEQMLIPPVMNLLHENALSCRGHLDSFFKFSSSEGFAKFILGDGGAWPGLVDQWLRFEGPNKAVLERCAQLHDYFSNNEILAIAVSDRPDCLVKMSIIGCFSNQHDDLSLPTKLDLGPARAIANFIGDSQLDQLNFGCHQEILKIVEPLTHQISVAIVCGPFIPIDHLTLGSFWYAKSLLAASCNGEDSAFASLCNARDSLNRAKDGFAPATFESYKLALLLAKVSFSFRRFQDVKDSLSPIFDDFSSRRLFSGDVRRWQQLQDSALEVRLFSQLAWLEFNYTTTAREVTNLAPSVPEASGSHRTVTGGPTKKTEAQYQAILKEQLSLLHRLSELSQKLLPNEAKLTVKFADFTDRIDQGIQLVQGTISQMRN